VRDDFDREGELGVGWQWLIGSKPAAHLAGGALTLHCGRRDFEHRSYERGPLHHRASFVAETGSIRSEIARARPPAS